MTTCNRSHREKERVERKKKTLEREGGDTGGTGKSAEGKTKQMSKLSTSKTVKINSGHIK